MKKQFEKFKNKAAENLSWSNKADCGDSELELVDKHVEHYRDSLDKIVRKLPAAGSGTSSSSLSSGSFEHRTKKNVRHKLGLTFEECARDVSNEMPKMQYVLIECAELEKSIAEHIVKSEQQTESRVVGCLRQMLDKYSPEIATSKRNVSKTAQDAASAKNKYENALKGNETDEKLQALRATSDEYETRLQKERDAWAANMYEFIAQENEVVASLRDYVDNQRHFYERSLKTLNASLLRIDSYIQTQRQMRFGTSLAAHLNSTDRQIAYVIELCACALSVHGIDADGLLRVACQKMKLRRLKYGLDAQRLKTPLPKYYYQEPHLIACCLKQYLRDLPEPLLTFALYDDFMRVASYTSEDERKLTLKRVLAELPTANYDNLRYLTHFLRLVVSYQERNRMNTHNVAIVMAPNMLWPPPNTSNEPNDYASEVNSSANTQVIVSMLIDHWDYFFAGEIDLFVTFDRKTFLEESDEYALQTHSTETYTKRDPEVAESPRYNTIRRQKASAPSPPVKTNSNGAVELNGVKQRPTVRELFADQQQANSEKPVKPPVPKFPSNTTVQQTFSSGKQEEGEQFERPQPIETPNKPQPMTRTQFFNFDQPPTPSGDRRSVMLSSFTTPKPEVPQKPKVTPRPITLGLSNSFRKTNEDQRITPPPIHGNGDSAQCSVVLRKNSGNSSQSDTESDKGTLTITKTTPNSPLSSASSNQVRRSCKGLTTPTAIRRPTEPAPPPPTITKKPSE